MSQAGVKLIAFDLDGTLSQHRSTPPPDSFALLDEQSKDYRLLMVGAGACERIHRQMKNYPIDIIGKSGRTPAIWPGDLPHHRAYRSVHGGSTV